MLAVCLLLSVVSSVFFDEIEQRALAIMTADAAAAAPTPEAIISNVLKQAPPMILAIVAVYLWPIVLAALTWGLRWPQFVRPLALTLVAFALVRVYLLTGLLAGALFSGGWSGLIYHALWFLDPSGFLILVFSLFLRGPPGGQIGNSAGWYRVPRGTLRLTGLLSAA